MPKISIIIPVYNAEKYLRQSLDSAKNQTFRDIEILCVDDGSTDDSVAILEEYVAKDDRFKIYRRNHQGGGATRNFGMSQARGEFLYFLDADDSMSLELCEKTYRKAMETGADIVTFFFTLMSNAELSPSLEGLNHGDKVDCLEKIKALYYNWQPPWICLWRKSFLDINSIRFPEHLASHDLPFSTEAAIEANKIVVLPERLYYYYVRDHSIGNMRKNIPNRMDTVLYTLQLAEKKGVSEEGLKWMTGHLLSQYYYYCIVKDKELQILAEHKMCQDFPSKYWKWLQDGLLPMSPSVTEYYCYISGNGISPIYKMIFYIRKKLRNSKWNQQFKRNVHFLKRLFFRGNS